MGQGFEYCGPTFQFRVVGNYFIYLKKISNFLSQPGNRKIVSIWQSIQLDEGCQDYFQDDFVLPCEHKHDV
jgi:hypothetical protein